MIKNYVCVYDLETGGKNKYKCQPVQISAIMIDLPRLEIVEDSLFESKIKPIWDKKICEKEGIDEFDDGSIEIHRLTREILDKAPELTVVWENFQNYLKQYNLKGLKGRMWDAPIPGGFNNRNFDDFIIRRLCERYGPKLDEWGGWKLFHPVHNFDLYQTSISLFHNKKISSGRVSYSLDTLREYHGISKEQAHNAKKDVLDTAFLLIKHLRMLREISHGHFYREVGENKYSSIQFKNCFEQENEKIKGLL
ncbi:MAG: hypothetical protein ACFFG0_27385 [Candidatus Thorarchaeota archaeon]